MRMKTYMGFLAVVLALAGCDDGDDKTDAGMTDAGMVTGDDGGGMTGDDGGMMTGDDGGMTGETCGARTVALEMGEQTITGDTTGGGTDLDLGECQGPEPAPQDIVALTIPGSASEFYGVRFDLAQAGTAETFDTIVQVRETCDDPEGLLCFDDGPADFRSAGQFAAPGGSTRFLIVSAYAPPWEEGNTTEGPYEAAIEVVGPLSAPVLTGATAVNIDAEALYFTLMGSDADMDADAVRMQFLDASGALIAIDDDGEPTTPTVEEFIFPIDGAEGEATFTATTIIGIEGVTELDAATQVRVELVDAVGLRSASMDIPLVAGSWADFGEACDETNICSTGECIDNTCQPPAAVTAACGAASALAPTADTPASATGTLEPGATNLFVGSCGLSEGGEDLYTVTVPAVSGDAIAYDLIASTDNTVSADAEADTLVYIQSTCGDAASELACHDDIDYPDNPRSLAIIEDAAEGTYTVVVDTYFALEASTDYQLDVSLRPVLGAGATCDPAGVANRCSTGPCPTSGTAECPAAP